MPTTPTTLSAPELPEEYDFLASFQRACEKRGLDFRPIFDTYFVKGYILKGPEYLMLGSPHNTRPDTWHVMWAEFHPWPGRMVAVGRLVRMMPYPLKYVGWSRALRDGPVKTRYYLTERVLRLTAGMPTATHAIPEVQFRS